MPSTVFGSPLSIRKNPIRISKKVIDGLSRKIMDLINEEFERISMKPDMRPYVALNRYVDAFFGESDVDISKLQLCAAVDIAIFAELLCNRQDRTYKSLRGWLLPVLVLLIGILFH